MVKLSILLVIFAIAQGGTVDGLAVPRFHGNGHHGMRRGGPVFERAHRAPNWPPASISPCAVPTSDSPPSPPPATSLAPSRRAAPLPAALDAARTKLYTGRLTVDEEIDWYKRGAAEAARSSDADDLDGSRREGDREI